MINNLEHKFKVYYCIKKKKSNPAGDIINDFYFQDELGYVYAKDKHEAVEKFFKNFGFMNVISIKKYLLKNIYYHKKNW